MFMFLRNLQTVLRDSYASSHSHPQRTSLLLSLPMILISVVGFFFFNNSSPNARVVASDHGFDSQFPND